MPAEDLKRIEEIEARLAKATPGPWTQEGATIYVLEHHGWRNRQETFHNRAYAHVEGVAGNPCKSEVEGNAALFANAPDDLRFLLDLAKRALQDSERLEKKAFDLTVEAAAWRNLAAERGVKIRKLKAHAARAGQKEKPDVR